MVGDDHSGAGTSATPAKTGQKPAPGVDIASLKTELEKIPDDFGVTEDFEHYWILDKANIFKINFLNPAAGIKFQRKIAEFNKFRDQFLAQRGKTQEPGQEWITLDNFEDSQLKMIEYVLTTGLREKDGSPLDYDKLLNWDREGWSLVVMSRICQDLVTFLKEIGSKAVARRLQTLSKLMISQGSNTSET